MPKRKLNAALCKRIHARRRDGLDGAQIARELDVSPATVSRVLRSAAPAPAATDPRATLRRVLMGNGTDQAAHDAALAVLGLDERFASARAKGANIVDALLELDVVEPLAAGYALRSSSGIAGLVLGITERPGGISSREDNGEGRAELARAIEILEGALKIVRKRGVARRWRTASLAGVARRTGGPS